MRHAVRGKWMTAWGSFSVGHAALTMAEYFRDDEQRDVLLIWSKYFSFYPRQEGSYPDWWGKCPPRLDTADYGTELIRIEERIGFIQNRYAYHFHTGQCMCLLMIWRILAVCSYFITSFCIHSPFKKKGQARFISLHWPTSIRISKNCCTPGIIARKALQTWQQADTLEHWRNTKN